MQKRSVTIEGHRTSISLEEAFWSALQEIAQTRKVSIQALIGEVERDRTTGLKDLPQENLSSAVRVMILKHYQRSERNAAQI